MNKVAFFHIGLPKTATKTIEEVFRRQKNINLIYASRYFQTQKYWDADNIYTNNIDNGKKVFIESDENLVSGSAYGFTKFIVTISRIARYNPNARIILTIREQRDLISSYYRNSIKFGTRVGFNKWIETKWGMDLISSCMYSAVIRNLITYFNKENIHIFLYEDLKYNYYQFFNELFGLIFENYEPNSTEKIYVNKGLDENILFIIKKLNFFKFFHKFIPSRTTEIKRIQNQLAIFIAKNIAPLFKNKNIKTWDVDNLLNKGIWEEFKINNNELIELGFVSREKLEKYNYLI